MGDALEDWLAPSADGLPTRTVQIVHNVPARAIRQAERDNLAGRNVAALAGPPKGQASGRPSEAGLGAGVGAAGRG